MDNDRRILKEKIGFDLDRERNKVLIIKVIGVIVVIILLTIISIQIDNWFKTKDVSWKIMLPTFMLSYLILCIRVLSGTQKGVKELIGIPYSFTRSGLHFVLFPLEKIFIYSKGIQRIDIPQQKIITTYNSQSSHSATTITANITFYFFWPDKDDLIITYCVVPRKKIRDFFEHALMDGVRTATGQLTWQECTCSVFQEKIAEELRNLNNPITKAAITNFRIAITDLVLPKELENALIKPEVAELDKIAKIKISESDMERRKLTGIGDATARQAIYNEISAKGDVGLAYEILLTLREMADGKSTTMFYNLPAEISGILDKALGGSKSTTGEIVNALGGKEGIQKLAKSVQKLTNK